MMYTAEGDVASGELLARAIELHRSGDLSQAQTIYRTLLQHTPDMPDVLYLLGLVDVQKSHWEGAIECFSEAVRLRPGFTEAHLQQAKACQQIKAFAQAAMSYQRVEVLDPACLEAVIGLGQSENALGLFDAALLSFSRVLVVDPENILALQGESFSLMHNGRNEEALESMQLAFDIDPDSTDININLGVVLQSLHRPDEALVCFDRIIALDAGLIAGHINRGNVLVDLKRYGAAALSYQQALVIDQGSLLAHMGNGNALHKQGKELPAVLAYNEVLLLSPGHAEALFNRGVCFQQLNRPEEALVSYRDAAGIDPDYLTALNNLGNTQQDLGLYSQALKTYRHAQAIEPAYADAHWNEAVCLLKTGDLIRGWEKYEWRWDPALLNPAQKLGRAIGWDGEASLAGKNILVTAEQGLGDTIQFCRYLPLLTDLGAAVTFAAPSSLLSILEPMVGIKHLLDERAPINGGFDFEMPLLSLPRAFATTLSTIPASLNYLHASDLKTQEWLVRCGIKRSLRIGIVIDGNPNNTNNAARAFPAGLLGDLLRTDVEWFCLQRELAPATMGVMDSHDVRHFGSALTDFSETAGFINNMDMVISVDTSVAHLAAAMGKPTWILLAHNADFRWLIGRNDSPWYPSVQLFRQKQAADWASVTDDIRQRLSGYIDGMSLGLTKGVHLTPILL